jgi:methyl-accepting chemotaxis protein
MSMARLQWVIPVLAIVLAAIVSSLFSSSASRRLADLGAVDSPSVALSQSLIFDLSGVEDSLKSSVASADKELLKTAAGKAERFRRDVDALAAIPGRREVAVTLKKDFENYFGAAVKVSELLLSNGELGDVAAPSQAMQSARESLGKALDQLKSNAQGTLTANIQSAQDSVRMGLAAGLIGSVIVLIVSFVVSRRAVARVMADLGGAPADAKHIVQRIAGGDLSLPVELARGDNDSLLSAMQGMQTQLSHIIGDVRTSVTQVNSTTHDIASGCTELREHMAHQVGSLEDTASRIEQLTDSVRHNAESAQQADRLASGATAEAENGGRAVAQAVATMDEINQSARKIVEITAVIDGIAFQTNILALNAAVEAARAGEAGRGFAVVASEVRNLAQRAGAAAKEIKLLIDDSVTRIDTGSQYAHAAGEAMTNLVASVKRVGDLIAEISTASSEQRSDIERVNDAIAELKNVTHQNAELVQNAEQAAHALQDVALHLDRSVSLFKLADAGPAAVVPGSVPGLARASASHAAIGMDARFGT